MCLLRGFSSFSTSSIPSTISSSDTIYSSSSEEESIVFCGPCRRMSKDVQGALKEALADHWDKFDDAVIEYLKGKITVVDTCSRTLYEEAFW